MRFADVKKPAYILAASVAVLAASNAHVSWPTRSQAAQGDLWTTQAPSSTVSSNNPNVDINVAKLNQAFTDLAKRMSPTVVNIYTKTAMNRQRAPQFRGMPQDDFEFFFRRPFEDRSPREAQALGSGFVINTEGYIVTNAHVVRMAGKNADEIMVKFIGEDSSKGHAAKVVGVDEPTDVALLKLVERKEGLKAAPLGDSDKANVGEWVVAIGNPYGHTHTLTQGVVSAVGRSLEGLRADFIQTSASINPGNSGGPLINMAGEVVGINTAIDPRAQGIGFAVPINSAKNVISQLVTTGRVARGFLGISIQDLNDEIAGYMKLPNQEGVLVREVMPNQPAALAGMETYDVIRKINGQEVRSTKDLYKSIEKLPIGQTAEVEVLRNNDLKRLKVQIGESPARS